MIKRNSILFFLIIVFSLTSCVSKKKFLEMQNGRLSAEELSRKLTEENDAKAARIKALIEDFELMKNELLESNAIKDHYIDSLNGELNVLAEKLNMKEESLQETSFNLDFEKQRMTEAIAAKNRSLQSLQVKISDLESEISEKSLIIEQKNFDIQKEKDNVSLLEGKVLYGEQKIEELEMQLNDIKVESDTLKSHIKVKDATILKLQNNVKLLKKELGN